MPGFRRRVLVDIDRLMSYANELRASVPAEMQEAEEVIRQKDSMINQASLEARRIKEAAAQEAAAITETAQREHLSKVDETEIVRAAEVKAEEIREEALQESRRITQEAQEKAFRMTNESEAHATRKREGADQYAREVLAHLEEELSVALGQVRRGMDRLSQDIEDRAVAAA